MKTENRQFDKRSGSALILVVVVTVLLAVVGVMFLMVSRASELETAAVVQSKDLDGAVDTVVARINDVLVDDLFGQNNTIVDADTANPDADEPYDYPSHHALDPGPDGTADTPDDTPWAPGPDGNYGTSDDIWLFGLNDDAWLASLETSIGVDGFGNPVYYWRHITDIFNNNFGVPFSPVYYDPQNELNDSTEWDGSKPELIVDAQGTLAKIISPKDRTYVIQQSAADWSRDLAGARADADGDGVADSRWAQIPSLTTSRGEPVYAAVRIIDNGAMLNLNGAFCFFPGDYDGVSPFEKRWYEKKQVHPSYTATPTPYHDNQGSGSGHYLTEINYLPFLRGHDLNGNIFDNGTSGEPGDGWYNILTARNEMLDVLNDEPFSPQQCQAALFNIENNSYGFQFFDIGDELELRNRYLLTSKTEARFEQADVANYSLDSGGGSYSALSIPREDKLEDGIPHIDRWYWRMNPANFDQWSGAAAGFEYLYDRRHVCTAYSYDRVFRRGQGPLTSADLVTAGWSAADIANAPRELSWYPQLFNELTALGWGQPVITARQRIFWPVGPVTTDIQDPALAQPYNNTETRRRILHLLFAFREYFYQNNGSDVTDAAKKAAQVVANIIDYADDDAIVPTSADRQGPFYPAVFTVGPDSIDYGQQQNVDCTFITEDIIEGMIAEVSNGLIPVGTLNFGLNAGDVIFGYEKQPFISEVYLEWNNAGNDLLGFAVELLNPYSEDIYPKPDAASPGWMLKIGDGSVVNDEVGTTADYFPKYDTTVGSPGRYVIRSDDTGVSLAAGPLVTPTYEMAGLSNLDTVFPGPNFEIQLLRPAPANSGHNYICVDRIPSTEVLSLFVNGRNGLKRDDDNWRFIYGDYVLQRQAMPAEGFTLTLGQQNNAVVTMSNKEFQIGVADDMQTSLRWHDLEVLGLYGNVPEDDPNTISTILSDAGTSLFHFNLEPGPVGNNDLLDYIAPINRPDTGTLPGRININTATVQVIAAAIPPTLADPNAADPAEVVTMSALQLAQKIVDYRQTNGPFAQISDLLNIPEFRQYITTQTWAVPDAENVGMQSIEDDIEEAHWMLSCLANKLTVRSDVFTAYILVRLGENGPQRRMIAIFDRSGVWNKNDRPKLVALHPVPDPR